MADDECKPCVAATSQVKFGAGANDARRREERRRSDTGVDVVRKALAASSKKEPVRRTS